MLDELVSIITPVYNAERFIRYTINSVQRQTYSNWEMIIVDDCSNDKSCEIIRKFAKSDKRIKYIKLDENLGVVNARNLAISNSSGRYIAFLDSDDRWKPQKLEKHIQFMIDNNVAFTFSSYDVVNENGENMNRTVYVPRKIDYNGYLKNTIIGCLTVVIDKNKVKDIKIINAPIEDFASWLQILKKIDYAYGINEVLAEYRVVRGSSSYNKIKAAKGAWTVYREVEKLNLISASIYFGSYIFNAINKRRKLKRMKI